jgi:hypothetical protein
MAELLAELQTLFDRNVDRSRSIGWAGSAARVLLQLFVLRFFSTTTTLELAKLGERLADRREVANHPATIFLRGWLKMSFRSSGAYSPIT